MKKEDRSPCITHLSWGRIEIEGGLCFKDAKLYPGGCKEWNWSDSGTDHKPGIQPSDVQDLLEHGAKVVVISTGVSESLSVCPETLELLKDKGISIHILQTEEAVRTYNELREREPVGGLFHTTC
jgi:hypothetical protein